MNKEIENWFYTMLENEPLEDIFERFNIDAFEAFSVVFEAGLIDEEELKELSRC